MKEKQYKNKKRLRLVPLILGAYGAFLGFGLMRIGLAGIREGIGLVRLLLGLGMAGFGVFGIWDGLRDVVRPEEKTEQPEARQLILTDTSGNRSSLVTPEALREQIDILVGSEAPKRFDIQILPPLPAGGYGLCKQILCVYHGSIILVAFFEMPKDGYRIYQNSMEAEQAVEWLGRLPAGSPDFSGWENIEAKALPEEEAASQDEDDAAWNEEDSPDEAGAPQEGVEAFWRRLLYGQEGQMFYWHRLLVIFGESWHDEHKFFSARDVELAVEGVHGGKYQKAVLEWGTETIYILPGMENGLEIIWRSNHMGRGENRFLARSGTANQVKFWLNRYWNDGFFEAEGSWEDITARVKKELRKGEGRHGKIF